MQSVGAARTIIETWFRNYKGPGQVEIIKGPGQVEIIGFGAATEARAIVVEASRYFEESVSGGAAGSR